MARFSIPEANFKQFFRNNRFFFIFFLAFWIPMALTLLYISLGDVVKWTNANRTAFGDFFFSNGTHLGEEIAYIGLLLIFLFIRYRTAIMIPLIGVAVFLVSLVLKLIFGYPRPAVYFKFRNEFDLLQPLENIILNEGWNSFPSGHTMSGFALYSYIAFSSKYKRTVGALMLVIAAIVGISRIYLMQHFLRDVVVGSLMGVGIAMMFHFLQYRIYPKDHPWANKNLLRKKATLVDVPKPTPTDTNPDQKG